MKNLLTQEFSTLESVNSVKSKNLVACVSDKAYLGHLKTLLISLKNYKSEVCVAVCLANIDLNDPITEKLKKIYSNIIFYSTNKDFEINENKKAYYCNLRVSYLNNLLEEGASNILYIDVDSIFRQNIDDNFFLNEAYDIMIHFRQENDPRFRVATGVIFINNSPMTQSFFKQWKVSIEKNIYQWFSDQITFFETFEKFKDKMIFLHLEKSFIDWEFRSGSLIWAGKGPRKYKNLIYLLERLRMKVFNSKLNRFLSSLQNLLRYLNK